MHEKGTETPAVHEKAESLEDAGHSVVAIGNDEHVCGLISIADTPRRQAGPAAQALRRRGIRTLVMVTGDNAGTASAIGRAVGIDEVRAELLPEDKLRVVEDLLAREGNTAMVGDGINDAPALAAATVGIAMGVGGTDTAIETADIALMSDDLSKLPWLIGHAQRTLRVIRQNIAISLGLKVLVMALAVAGLATLWMAIVADMGASLVVISNGLRLLDSRART
jgi:Cd2+/Zn2+-exporting ATPase